jgi:rubrerythrin
MTYGTVEDLLDHVQKFHNQASQYYQELSRIADKQRVKMLLEYMSRHEKYLEECLLEYENDVPIEVLKTWSKYKPQSTYQECFEDSNLNHDMSVADVLKLSLRLDDCLINVFRKMYESTESRKIKELFNNLLNVEKHEEKSMVRESLELKACKIIKLLSLNRFLN